MKACERVDEFLDGRLRPDESVAFERHLRECSECNSMIEGWRELQHALAREATATEPDNIPQPGEVARLVDRARERRAPAAARHDRVIGLAAAVAAAMVLITLAVTVFEPQPQTETETIAPALATAVDVSARLFVGGDVQPLRPPAAGGGEIAAPDDGRVLLDIGEDRVGLAADGRLRLIEASEAATRLRLERGLVACSVERRAGDRRFAIDAGEFAVRVRGTRFAVEIDGDSGLAVSVAEGTVEVDRAGERLGLVEGGQFLAVDAGGTRVGDADGATLARLDELLADRPSPGDPSSDERPELAASDGTEPGAAIAEPPRERPSRSGSAAGSFETWREWIIQGRFDEAEHALADHLRTHPGDGRAWSLLADGRRKAGRWQSAVQAYRSVIENASAGEANRARFMAGTILQDRLGNHAAAADLFAEYASSTGQSPLRAEAQVRRARCLIDLGRETEAVRLLENVIEKHAGTSAAIKARRLLDRLGAVGEGNGASGQ
jgi:TolA-binding protein/anti-sigma factor RsiW